jgi:cell division protein FtsI (penicillin-binding protein 3)
VFIPGTDPQANRLKFLRFLVVLALAAFVFRLLDFQIFSSEKINGYSLLHRKIVEPVPAKRGDIVDYNGKVLATTVSSWDLTVDPTLVHPFDRTVNGTPTVISVSQATRELATVLKLRPGQVAVKLRGDSKYSLVADNLGAAEYLRIKRLNIPWVYTPVHYHRVYPNGALAGNLLGFVGSDGTPLEGIELSENKCLAGVNGEQAFLKSSDGIKIPGTVSNTVAPQDGGTVRLSIDSDLQFFAQQIMAKYVRDEKAEWGTAVIVDAKTGRVIAAADAPSVDPNNPGGVSAADRSTRIFRTPIEPGSTMKTVTAATAIDQGVATPLTQVVAPQRSTVAGNFVISDSHTHPTEHLTLQGVLIESSNTGIIKVGIRVPYSVRYSYWRKFGLGEATGVGFQGEAGGTVHKLAPDGASVYTSMFGQAITVTPIQSAMAYQTFANGGVRLAPKLLESCTATNGSVTPLQKSVAPVQVIKAATAKTIVTMLENDVSQKGGIGSTAAIPGYRVGGKTGTAQIALPGGGYGSYHAISFIGMAPAENPRFVVAVTIYKPRTVSTSLGATPPFKAIMQQVLRAYRIPPSTTKSPKIPARW